MVEVIVVVGVVQRPDVDSRAVKNQASSIVVSKSKQIEKDVALNVLLLEIRFDASPKHNFFTVGPVLLYST